MRVRRAREGDIPWLLLELEQFAQFLGTKHSLLSEDTSIREQILRSLVADHLFFVAVKDVDERVGLVAGVVAPHMLNPALIVFSELFWWVPPKYRGSRAGLLLLDAVLDWATKNVDWVMWSFQHNSGVTDRVLLKRGFVEQERRFLLEV